MDDTKMEIGDCPKCEKRTFVVYGITEGGKLVSIHGYCYKCGLIFDTSIKSGNL